MMTDSCYGNRTKTSVTNYELEVAQQIPYKYLLERRWMEIFHSKKICNDHFYGN